MKIRCVPIVACWALVLMVSTSAVAGPTRLAFRNATVVGGTTVVVPVYVDSSLTGLGVISYQLDISFNATYLTYDSVFAAGSMTETWSYLEGNAVSSGRLLVAGSGSTVLSDTGRLVFVRFKAKVPSSNVNTTISFTSATTLFNEGGIPLSFASGTITVQVPPSITVSPNTALVTRGETQQFTVSGGTGPYSWTTTDLNIATIDASGLLAGVSPGIVKVISTDALGVIDTSGSVEIRGMKLSVRDTTRYQGQTVDLPIYTTSLSGLAIASGQLTVTYNQNLLTATGVVQAGTLLASAGVPEFSVSPGSISVSFASSSVVGGAGILLYIRFQASETTYGYSTIGFQGVLFNEDLLANTQSGTLTVTALPAVSVSPGGTQNLVKGESIQFTASGGTGPYTWSVSDSQKAMISPTGVLQVKRGGVVLVSAKDALGSVGSSGTVNLYDFRLRVSDTGALITAPTDTAVEVPLMVTSNDTGFVSFQLRLSYPTSNNLSFDSPVTSSTLATGWTVVPGSGTGTVQIAAAGINPVTSLGTLIRLRFLVPNSTPNPSISSLTLSNVLFNEGAPIPLIENGIVQIRSTNTKPTFSSRTPTSLDSVVIYTPAVFTVSAFDPDGDPLTYTWKVNGVVEKLGSSNSLSRSFTTVSPGTAVTAIFADPFGWKDSTTWTFRVVTHAERIETGSVPSTFMLGQNFPNPFNPSTTIRYQLPNRMRISLRIYDLLGKEVETLVDSNQEAGYYEVRWTPRVASGVYFYRLESGLSVETRKLMLVK